MSKSFKIGWHAILAEGNIIEGRSIVEAETDQEAANKLIAEKSSEYRLKSSWIVVDALVELVKKSSSDNVEEM